MIACSSGILRSGNGMLGLIILLQAEKKLPSAKIKHPSRGIENSSTRKWQEHWWKSGETWQYFTPKFFFIWNNIICTLLFTWGQSSKNTNKILMKIRHYLLEFPFGRSNLPWGGKYINRVSNLYRVGESQVWHYRVSHAGPYTDIEKQAYFWCSNMPVSYLNTLLSLGTTVTG